MNIPEYFGKPVFVRKCTEYGGELILPSDLKYKRPEEYQLFLKLEKDFSNIKKLYSLDNSIYLGIRSIFKNEDVKIKILTDKNKLPKIYNNSFMFMMEYQSYIQLNNKIQEFKKNKNKKFKKTIFSTLSFNIEEILSEGKSGENIFLINNNQSNPSTINSFYINLINKDLINEKNKSFLPKAKAKIPEMYYDEDPKNFYYNK